MDALPDTPLHKDTRVHLAAQIAFHKRAIIRLRPMGGQLDGCKAAMDRAKRRRADAVAEMDAARQMMDAARQKVEKADVEIVSSQEELTSLEGAITAKPGSPDCVEQMASSLQSVLVEMGTSGAVPSALLKETEAHMATLLSGIQAIAKAAQQQQQQHQGAGEDTAGMDVSDGSARGVKRPEETEEEARRRISRKAAHPEVPDARAAPGVPQAVASETPLG